MTTTVKQDIQVETMLNHKRPSILFFLYLTLVILLMGCSSANHQPDSTVISPKNGSIQVVWPVLTKIEPDSITANSTVTIYGIDGYVVENGDEVTNLSKSFDIKFNGTQAGSIICVEKSCEGSFPIPTNVPIGDHLITTEGGSQLPVNIALNGQILTKIRERLGYAMFPIFLPKGIEFVEAKVSGIRGHLIFDAESNRINISFPVTFSKGGALIQGDPNSPRRPQDAVKKIDIGENQGYLIKGKWSDDTIAMGPFIEPSMAKWDYEGMWSLYWETSVNQNKVGVVIQVQSSIKETTAIGILTQLATSLKEQ